MPSAAYLRRLFQQGLDLHARGSLAEAERVYRRLLTEAPADPEVLQVLGALCAQQGRNTEAIELLHRAIARNALSAPPFVVLANVLAAEGRIGGELMASRVLSLGSQTLSSLMAEELRVRSRDLAFERALERALDPRS